MMRSEKYSRLLRSLMADILKSDLTDKELRELFELMEGGRLGQDLATMLEGYVWRMHSQVHTKSIGHDKFVDLVLEAGASKAALHNIISSMLSDNAPAKSKTMREMVHEFEERSSLEQKKKLLDILQSDIKDDAYLRGISERYK